MSVYPSKNLYPPLTLRHTELTDKEIGGVIDHANLSITTEKIRDGAITTAKIADLSVTPSKLSFRLWEGLGEIILTSAATEVGFNNLDGDVDKCYLIIWKIKVGAAGPFVVHLKPNGVAGARAVGVGAYYDGVNKATELFGGPYMAIAEFEGRVLDVVEDGLTIFDARSGYVRSCISIHGGPDAAAVLGDRVRCRVISGYWGSDTSTKITSLYISATVANALGAGSRFTLFRLSR